MTSERCLDVDSAERSGLNKLGCFTNRKSHRKRLKEKAERLGDYKLKKKRKKLFTEQSVCAIIVMIRFVKFIKEHSLGSTNKGLDCKKYVLVVHVFFREVWFLPTQQNLT